MMMWFSGEFEFVILSNTGMGGKDSARKTT